MRSALAWTVVVALGIAGRVASANSLELGKQGLIDPSGGNMSMELNGTFSTLYEPSGIAPLSDGRFLVVEDEPERALRLISAELSDTGLVLVDESRLELPSSLAERLAVGELDDLEAAAHDELQRYYVVSSHDDSLPYRISKRQKLLRFSIRDGRMRDVATILTLRRDLLAGYPQLADNAREKGKKNDNDLNIEALAYDRSRNVLLVGLRAPLVDDMAIIIRLLNPDAYLNGDAQPELGDSLWSVDLDKGGLRAMTYDDQTDQLLLISRREDHDDASYKLWRLPANGKESAVRIKLGEQKEMLDSVEGLVSIDLGPSWGLGVMFVRDNGNEKKGRGADWFILSRSQLGLASEMR